MFGFIRKGSVVLGAFFSGITFSFNALSAAPLTCI